MMTSNLFGFWIYLINMNVIQVVMRQLFFCFENVWRFRASEKTKTVAAGYAKIT